MPDNRAPRPEEARAAAPTEAPPDAMQISDLRERAERLLAIDPSCTVAVNAAVLLSLLSPVTPCKGAVVDLGDGHLCTVIHKTAPSSPSRQCSARIAGLDPQHRLTWWACLLNEHDADTAHKWPDDCNVMPSLPTVPDFHPPEGICLICGQLRPFGVWVDQSLTAGRSIGACVRCRDARHVVVGGAVLSPPRTGEELVAAANRVMQHYLGDNAPAYGDARFVLDCALQFEDRAKSAEAALRSSTSALDGVKEEAARLVRQVESLHAEHRAYVEQAESALAAGERDPHRYDQAPDGCWVACIAGLTDIPHEAFTALIPYHAGQFDGSMGTEYRNAVNQLLRSRGWRLESVGPDVPRGFAVGSGTSPRGLFHAVLVKDGQLWHDPHPSRDGIPTLESYEVVIPIRPVLAAVEQFERWRAALAPGHPEVDRD